MAHLVAKYIPGDNGQRYGPYYYVYENKKMVRYLGKNPDWEFVTKYEFPEIKGPTDAKEVLEVPNYNWRNTKWEEEVRKFQAMQRPMTSHDYSSIRSDMSRSWGQQEDALKDLQQRAEMCNDPKAKAKLDAIVRKQEAIMKDYENLANWLIETGRGADGSAKNFAYERQQRKAYSMAPRATYKEMHGTEERRYIVSLRDYKPGKYRIEGDKVFLHDYGDKWIEADLVPPPSESEVNEHMRGW